MNTGSKPGKEPLFIDIRLKSPRDLFASLDPSPLVERDLDNAVEEFIVESAIDSPHSGPITLVIHLAEAPTKAETSNIEESICHYFDFMANRERRRMARLWREGRQALFIGLIFLGTCMAFGQAAATLIHAPFAAILREGLLIIGWVANWKPVEILLYDWRPLHQRRRIYDRLSEAKVEVRAVSAS
jgi:hypothetical protein